MAAACNNSGNQAKETNSKVENGTAEAYDPTKLKDQIIQIIQNSPKGFELVEMLNKAGASYMLDFTVPVERSEKMLTTTSKGLGVGMFGFDTKYASTYNRGDVAMEINATVMKLFADLGVAGDISVVENYIERIANNKSNKDSVEILTSLAFTEYHKQMVSGVHATTYALTVIGANVEALYMLTQMSLYAKDNTKFLELMSNQKARVKSVSDLLETMSGDETLKPYYDSMKPIVKFFEEHNIIGNAELKMIAPEIEKVRNSMI
jgi:hypothetical protein